MAYRQIKRKSNVFVNNLVRSKQIAKYFKQSCKDYHKMTQYTVFQNAYRNGNTTKAIALLEIIGQEFINEFDKKGLCGIGYILEFNVKRYGLTKTYQYLYYGFFKEFATGETAQSIRKEKNSEDLKQFMKDNKIKVKKYSQEN